MCIPPSSKNGMPALMTDLSGVEFSPQFVKPQIVQKVVPHFLRVGRALAWLSPPAHASSYRHLRIERINQMVN